MKMLNKITSLLLVLVMIISVLTSCTLPGNTKEDPHNTVQNNKDEPTESTPVHVHSYVNGKCTCGLVDPNYEPAHVHNYTDGVCSCGVIDPEADSTHIHRFVLGVCECGYVNPFYVPEIPPHHCETSCEECGLCLNLSCNESACIAKCEGHIDPNAIRYGYLPIISEVMPEIHINTADGSNTWATKYNRSDKLAGKIDYVDASVSTSMCDEAFVITDAEAEVKVRGNYTLDYAKKPIRIKFKSKTNLLGLHDGGEYKNWVLLADWKDLSMNNNTIAFYLGNTILGSDGYYCTDFRNVEVYLNGVYWGVYLLAEQQEVKDDRTSASEVEKDYTGIDIGYFFEYDGYYNLEGENGDPTFTINHQGLPASSGGYTVKSDIYSDEQLAFLKSYVENSLYIARQATQGRYYKFDSDYKVVANIYTTDAKAIIGSVIDIQSLVDTYILNELAKDLDVDWSSFYLSLDMSEGGSKKITFEAPWDFDSSFGLTHKDNCSPTEGLYAMSNANPWFRLVENQDWFWEMVSEKWDEIKKYGVLDNVISLIETQKETYRDYYIKNYTKWSVRVTNGNTECVSILNTFKDINTAQGLAADYTIAWLTARITWLDSQWSKNPSYGQDDGTEEDSKEDVNQGDEEKGEDNNEKDETPETSSKYRFEAENATLAGFVVSEPIRVNKDYASESSYVGNVATGTTISFSVTVEEDTTVLLYAGIAKRTSARNFSNMFTLTVNGEVISVPQRILPAISGDEEDWHSFISLELTSIELKKGENTITFKTVGDATNFDYIDIVSPIPCS